MINVHSRTLLFRNLNRPSITVLKLDRVVYYIPSENKICYLSEDEALIQTCIQSLLDLKLLSMSHFYKLDSNVFVNMNLVRSLKKLEVGFVLKTKNNQTVKLV